MSQSQCEETRVLPPDLTLTVTHLDSLPSVSTYNDLKNWAPRDSFPDLSLLMMQCKSKVAPWSCSARAAVVGSIGFQHKTLQKIKYIYSTVFFNRK